MYPFFELLSRAGIDSSDAPDDLLGESLHGSWTEQSLLFALGLEYYESKICNLSASEQRYILNTSEQLTFSPELSNLEKIAHEAIKAKSKERWDEINEQSLIDLVQVLQVSNAELFGFSVHMLRSSFLLASVSGVKLMLLDDLSIGHNELLSIFCLLIKEFNCDCQVAKSHSEGFHILTRSLAWNQAATGIMSILTSSRASQVNINALREDILQKINIVIEQHESLSLTKLARSKHISKTNIRVIAFYLPQYHPIPENDKRWGQGFTEWTNTSKAKPLFKGHYQPNIPGELGYYDLRLEESRIAQAELARSYGIEGFCYWHYWMGNGKRVLERPFNEVLATGKPDFPFCLGWANHDWQGVFFGSKEIHIRQDYPGIEDYSHHFDFLANAFSDPRYIRVDNKPLLYIYKIRAIPEAKLLVNLWKKWAHQYGFNGLFIVAEGLDLREMQEYGCDAISYSYHRKIQTLVDGENEKAIKIERKLRNAPDELKIFPYSMAKKFFLKPGRSPIYDLPQIYPNWDSTPRLGLNGVALYNSTPAQFGEHVREAIQKIRHKPADHQILFAKSWNEWAEGNYLEPDLRHGRQYLEALKYELFQ